MAAKNLRAAKNNQWIYKSTGCFLIFGFALPFF
jgi:hypothetical protein